MTLHVAVELVLAGALLASIWQMVKLTRLVAEVLDTVVRNGNRGEHAVKLVEGQERFHARHDELHERILSDHVIEKAALEDILQKINSLLDHHQITRN